MESRIHVAFCADSRVVPGLHVAAYSVLASYRSTEHPLDLHLISDDLTPADVSLLERTLGMAHKGYKLHWHSVSVRQFSDYPMMRGSLGPYLRLLVPELVSAARIVYLDVDTACYLDVGEFLTVDLHGHPAGFLAETTIGAVPDRTVSSMLSSHLSSPYLNSGVMLVDRELWLARMVTQKCMRFLERGDADAWDQSALNVVLHGDWCPLDRRHNFVTNWRSNWPALRDHRSLNDRLLHFLDSPKPWDFMGELVHPQYQLWRTLLAKTALAHFRSWHPTRSRRFPRSRKELRAYRKALKDRLLFEAYSRNWIVRLKGLEARG